MAAVLPFQMSPRRFVFIVLAFVLSLHYLLTIVFKDYASLPSFTKLGDKVGLSIYYSHIRNGTENDHSNHTLIANDTLISHTNVTASYSDRANATFVFLCRNSDLPGVVASIQQMEDRFNRQHGYPWVLLNEEPFTEEFKERVRVLTDAPVHFGQIPAEHWYQPEWIDEEQATANRLRMMAQGIIYAAEMGGQTREENDILETTYQKCPWDHTRIGLWPTQPRKDNAGNVRACNQYLQRNGLDPCGRIVIPRYCAQERPPTA
ncbi:glycosyltransferase family 15 protein [Hebeloma cylindrosporum]|uniref:Glycosyltransferase family 15 protein n=1 Tax=Hebeloma cylindrosporum TaxID=76867 RepID=A0A0C3CZ71_HEBCY|nr:glycosyltransferase family 15 protein [Hebeloma cylindrosporum h7]